MAKRTKQHCGSEAGSALVELALMMPIMMFLLVAVLEFARVAYAAIEVSNAAKANMALRA